MRNKLLLRAPLVSLAVLALFAGGSAAADAPGGEAGAGMSKPVDLTPKEQLAEVDAGLARMETTRQTVKTELGKARSDRDVVKTLCLNDKLTQIDVAIRSAHERRNDLKAAVIATIATSRSTSTRSSPCSGSARSRSAPRRTSASAATPTSPTRGRA